MWAATSFIMLDLLLVLLAVAASPEVSSDSTHVSSKLPEEVIEAPGGGTLRV